MFYLCDFVCERERLSEIKGDKAFEIENVCAYRSSLTKSERIRSL